MNNPSGFLLSEHEKKDVVKQVPPNVQFWKYNFNFGWYEMFCCYFMTCQIIYLFYGTYRPSVKMFVALKSMANWILSRTEQMA